MTINLIPNTGLPFLNIRSTPAVITTPDNRIDQLQPGEVMLALDTDASVQSKLGTTQQQGLWIRVRTPRGIEGFAAAWLVSVAGSAAAAATPSPTAPAPESSGSLVLVPNAGLPFLNIRSGPSVLTDPDNRVDQVQPGETMLALDADNDVRGKLGTTQPQNLWIRVRTPRGVIGFAAAWLVSLSAASAPVIPPVLPVPPVLPAPPAQPTPAAQPIQPTGIKLEPSGQRLNVRSAPLISNNPDNRVETLGVGDVLTALEPDAAVLAKLGTTQQNDQWIRVQTAKGNTGFAAAWLVQKAGSVNAAADLDSYINGLTNLPTIPQGYYEIWKAQTVLGLPNPFDSLPVLLKGSGISGLPINGFGPNSFAFANWRAYYQGVRGMHNGLDHIVPLGTPLLAVADGIIAGTQADWKFLSNANDKSIVLWPFLPPNITDSKGRRMLSNVLIAYGHLSDNTLVKKLDVVKAGQQIGVSGRPFGETSNDHLHMEVHMLSGAILTPILANLVNQRLLALFKRPQLLGSITPFNPLLFFSERLVKYHLDRSRRPGFGTTQYPTSAQLAPQSIQWPPLDMFSIASFRYGLPVIWDVTTLPYPPGIFDLDTIVRVLPLVAPFEPYPADFLPA